MWVTAVASAQHRKFCESRDERRGCSISQAAARSLCGQFRLHPPRLFPLLHSTQTLAPYREWGLYLHHGVFAESPATHQEYKPDISAAWQNPAVRETSEVPVGSVFMACKTSQHIPNASPTPFPPCKGALCWPGPSQPTCSAVIQPTFLLQGSVRGTRLPALAQTKSYYNRDPDSSLYLQKLLLQGTLREIMVLGFIH